MARSIGVFLLVMFCLIAVPAQAQTCPPGVLLAMARSGSACFQLERDEACYGNGTVAASFYGQSQASFAQPGAIVSAADLHEVTVQPNDDVSVALFYTRASLTAQEERNITLLLFGDATLENGIPPTPELVLEATGTVNIRETPEADGVIIMKVGIVDTLIANGRYVEDDFWLRVRVPNSEALGWVSTTLVNPRGDASTLLPVGLSTPLFRPFRQLNLRTNNDYSLCGGALPGGLLLQSPPTPVNLTINGADVQLTATAFLQAADTLTLYIMEGHASVTVNGETQWIPAGAQASVPLDENGLASAMPLPAEPYTMETVQTLPVNNLPLRVTIALPLTPEQIAEQVAILSAEPMVVEDVQRTPVADNRCRYRVKQPASLWAGPGQFYEAINEIREGAFVDPVLQVTDPDGETWWQLRNTNWIRALRVEQTGDCEPIPVTAYIPAPSTNAMSLETCETRNGPLRDGQRVTLEFIPPPWDNYGEARDAVIVDPGRISVNSQYLRVSASNPIRLGTVGERHLRIFSTTWVATPGSYRIVGQRLSYILTCSVTVPTG